MNRAIAVRPQNANASIRQPRQHVGTGSPTEMIPKRGRTAAKKSEVVEFLPP
jgi:hypothetical protein